MRIAARFSGRWEFCASRIQYCESRNVYPGDPNFFYPGFEFFPSRIRIFLDPGSASMNLSILTPKKLFLTSRKYDPGCSSRIRIFYSSGSQIQGSKRHRIPDPQHWQNPNIYVVILNSSCALYFIIVQNLSTWKEVRIGSGPNRIQILRQKLKGSASGSYHKIISPPTNFEICKSCFFSCVPSGKFFYYS